jgi:hypothetical protein
METKQPHTPRTLVDLIIKESVHMTDSEWWDTVDLLLAEHPRGSRVALCVAEAALVSQNQQIIIDFKLKGRRKEDYPKECNAAAELRRQGQSWSDIYSKFPDVPPTTLRRGVNRRLSNKPAQF